MPACYKVFQMRAVLQRWNSWVKSLGLALLFFTISSPSCDMKQCITLYLNHQTILLWKETHKRTSFINSIVSFDSKCVAFRGQRCNSKTSLDEASVTTFNTTIRMQMQLSNWPIPDLWVFPISYFVLFIFFNYRVVRVGVVICHKVKLHFLVATSSSFHISNHNNHLRSVRFQKMPHKVLPILFSDGLQSHINT